MGDLKKALQDLDKAVNSSSSVGWIKVTIKFEKPKPSKAEKDKGKANA